MMARTLASLRGYLALPSLAQSLSRRASSSPPACELGAICTSRNFSAEVSAVPSTSSSSQQDATSTTTTSTSSSNISNSSSSSPAPASSRAIQYGPRLVTQLRRRSKESGVLQEGVVHVHCTLNNTILTLTDTQGTVKASSSCGKVGFKNANKSTPLAAERAAEDLARKALGLGFGTAVVKLNGMGRNKMYAVQSLNRTGLAIKQIQDVTPIPYNGCRLARKRRT